jgi:alkylation response protein AidB-like acyl-CoA dehydrogenase
VQVGGDFVITGAKMFTSLAHVAQYMLCAARTDADAPPHRGITVFLVDMKNVRVSPIWTLGGFRTNETFLDEVLVPAENVVGELNGGWRVLMTALDFERAGTSRVGQAKRLLAHTAAAIDPDDACAVEALGRLYGEVLAVETLAYEVAWMQSQGATPTKEASLVKIAGTELVQRVAEEGTAALGPRGLLARGARGVLADGELEEEYRNTVRYTVTAGTNEIQRNIVAQRGLGLPRVAR